MLWAQTIWKRGEEKENKTKTSNLASDLNYFSSMKLEEIYDFFRQSYIAI